MFIDEIKLHLKAGDGGDGVVRWRHEKGKDHGGPSGGNGGKGGDVYAIAVRDIGALSAYRHIKHFEAERGENGFKDTKQGGTGVDIDIRFPVGSKITNLTTGHSLELLKDGEKVLLLHGGRGGLGNDHFKSSVNVRPKQSTDGALGEEADFEIELLLVVDVGFIGLPNAGKSSLLNALTGAKSKIGDFPFTTLEPSLGDYYGLILADIPGLIEGASGGKGLGHKFLRHIERTRALVHCLSSESEDLVKDYKVVRKELELYNKEIVDKPEIILLTKTDMISKEDMEAKLKALSKLGKEVFPMSILNDELVQSFGDYISKAFK